MFIGWNQCTTKALGCADLLAGFYVYIFVSRVSGMAVCTVSGVTQSTV